MSSGKTAKGDTNDVLKMGNFNKNTKSFLERFLEDVNKKSASKQVIIGVSSGWITGYLSMKVGKVIAVAIGGSIILLQIANEKGYIRVNWDKVNKNIDEAVDKIEEKITGEGPSFSNKVEKFVDRKIDKAGKFIEKKIDKAEDILKNPKSKAKHWFAGDSKCHLKEIHIFLVSFVAGVAISIATS